MSRDFDFMNAVLNETSKAQMNTDKMIDIDLIDPYETNDEIYPPEQYAQYREELIEDIREHGLKQTVELIPNPNNPGRYISIGGNRRCDAIRYLVHEEGLEKFRMVKSTITEGLSEDEVLERCIMSNSYREKTSYSTLKEIETLQNLAQKKKERGEKIPGGVRLFIASRSKVGDSQAGKGMRIINQGTEEVKEALKHDEVTFEAAAYITHLSAEEQKDFLEKIKNGEMTNKEVIDLVKESRKKPKPNAEQKPLDIPKAIKKVKKDAEILLKAEEAPEELKQLITNFLNEIENINTEN